MTLFRTVRQNTSGLTVGNENVLPFDFYCTILPVKSGDKKERRILMTLAHKNGLEHAAAEETDRTLNKL